MKPETLVILTPAFPANESETNWVPSQQLLVKHLNEQFPAVNIVVLSFLYPYEAKEYEWNGVTVFSFNGMKKRRLLRLKLWATVWKKLKQVQRSYQLIGIFSFWCGECALVGKLFAKRFQVRHYCWICGMDAKKENKLVRFIRPQPTELLGISDAVVEEFHRNHKIRPAHLLPNAIAPNMFSPVNTERSIHIMGAGSFSPFKQYDVFVRIIYLLNQHIPFIRTVHCGTGSPEETAHITGLIGELHLEENIELLGIRSHAEVIEQMQKAKILLHPSSYEGFSTACLEALYAGAHVISFCQPMKDPIHHWHVVKDENEMFNVALALLNDPCTDYSPVMVNDMEATAKSVMKLFVKETE